MAFELVTFKPLNIKVFIEMKLFNVPNKFKIKL